MTVKKIKYEIIDKKNINYNKLRVEIIKLFIDDDSNVPNIEEFIDHLKFIFNSKNNAFLVLLRIEGEIVSMVNYFEYNNLLHYWCEISLFVKKDKRKNNYAQLVFDKGVCELKKYQTNKLICGIEADNQASIYFHLKNKFKYSGVNWNELAEGFPENHLGFIYDENIDTKNCVLLYNIVKSFGDVEVKLNQNEFSELIDIAKNYINPFEALFRLAMNFTDEKINFELIEDYFIKKNNPDYLLELYSISNESNLNFDKSIKKLKSIDNREFIQYIIDNRDQANLSADFIKEIRNNI